MILKDIIKALKIIAASKNSNNTKVLSTRKTARDLFLKLNNEKKDTLDFPGVNIVSRSFANEWLNL